MLMEQFRMRTLGCFTAIFRLASISLGVVVNSTSQPSSMARWMVSRSSTPTCTLS